MTGEDVRSTKASKPPKRRTVQQLEGIATSDFLTNGRSLKRVRHWQRRLWKAAHPEHFGRERQGEL